MSTLSLYDKDFYAWTQEQVNLLRTNALSKLDIEHLIEEVESMGSSEKRELGHRLTILLMHLLKWKYQPARRGMSWELTIKEQRSELKYLLKQNPSLKNHEKLHETFLHAYDTSILKAAKETKLSPHAFPVNCEWTIDQILSDEFFPN